MPEKSRISPVCGVEVIVTSVKPDKYPIPLPSTPDEPELPDEPLPSIPDDPD